MKDYGAASYAASSQETTTKAMCDKALRRKALLSLLTDADRKNEESMMEYGQWTRENGKFSTE